MIHFVAMKWAAIATIMLVICVNFAPRSKADDSTKHITNTSSGQNETLPIKRPETEQAGTSQKEQPTENKPPHWYESPEWMLVIVGGITAFVIGWQSWETRKAAQAIANNERAWILVTMGDLPEFTPNHDVLEILYVIPTLKNYGRTPAIITKMRATPERIPVGFKLQPTADHSNIYTKNIDYEIPLPPDHAIQPVKIGIPTADFTPIFDGSFSQYIRGFVEYRDINNRAHTTEFCFIYHVPRGFNPDPAGFYAGPPEYNKIT